MVLSCCLLCLLSSDLGRNHGRAAHPGDPRRHRWMAGTVGMDREDLEEGIF